MKTRAKLAITGLVVLLLLTASLALQAQDATPSEEPAASMLYVFSNSSPHITVIDTATNQVINQQDVPDFTGWAWNDDNNYFDGENLWLGLRDPENNQAEVIALNLETLTITYRLSIGTEPNTLYIGKATKEGILQVSKQASGEVVVIDTKAGKVLDTWQGLPVNGDVVCDADVAVGADGVERFYYPTRKGDTVVSLDAMTGATDVVTDSPAGSTPLMLTTSPGGAVWVQEVSSNTNAVYDPTTLDLVGRFLTGKGPIVASFSDDGKYGYIGHSSDTFVGVYDTETLKEVARVEVGVNPQKVGVNPNGQAVYAILTKEAAVAVIDTATWQMTTKIDLGTNPTGIFVSGRQAPSETGAADGA